MGISEATFSKWKTKYGGLRFNVLRQLRQLEDETKRLKQFVADLILDKKMLYDMRKNSVCDECLNTHWFLSLDDAYERINRWVDEFNHFRPHSSLDDKTPAEFVGQCKASEEIDSSNKAMAGRLFLKLCILQ